MPLLSGRHVAQRPDALGSARRAPGAGRRVSSRRTEWRPSRKAVIGARSVSKRKPCDPEPLRGAANDLPVGVVQPVGRAGRRHQLERPAASLQASRDHARNTRATRPKLKAHLRKAAARTITDLKQAIRQAFASFTPAECQNYLAAAGYDAYDPT